MKVMMPWGRYKGEPIESLPSDYIEWCLGNIERMDSGVQEEMEAQLRARKGEGIARGRA